MKNKPNLYIIPGWGEKVIDPNYKRIIDFASKKYDFIPLKVSTRNRKYALGGDKSIFDILDKIEKQIIQPSEKDVLLGFSVGALQAYLLSKKLKFSKLLLCSMSPILGKDILSYTKEGIKYLSKEQYNELKGIDYMKIKTENVVLFYGDKENNNLKNRSISLGKRKGYESVEIKGVGHDLGELYFKKLKNFL